MRLLRLLGRAGAGLSSLLVALQLIRAVLPVAQALSVGRLVSVLFGSHDARSALVAAVLVAALFLTEQAAWLLITAIRTLVVKRIDGDLRARIRRLAAGLGGLEVLESSDFQDRASRAIDAGIGLARDRSAGTAAAGQLELTFRMLSAFGTAVLIATFSVPLAAGLLVVALVMRAVMRRQFLAVVDKLDADTAGQRYEYYVSEQAVYGAAKDVRLYGLSDWFAGRFRAAVTRTYSPVWRGLLATIRRQWWSFVVIGAAAAFILWLPAGAVLHGDLPAGRLITFVLAGTSLLSISAMGMEAFDIEYGLRGLAAADELIADYGRPIERAPAVPGAAPPVVEFDNVVFRYPGRERPVLNGLTVTLRPGETVAVVGENGVGKTTFVKLLAGLYRPESGRITVGGVDPREKRPALAALFQDYVRYPATLRENVTLAAPDHPADDDAVRAALDRAGAQGMPTDLDTSLWRQGSDGTDLSGGQWQRVALARVLYAVEAGRRLLVLDEPTAHLDVRSEAEFHERVVARVHDTTTVLISHRLSTVRPADRIILLRDGRVAEDGTHDELMALGGEYARFFTVQAAAFTGAGQGSTGGEQ
jgi:ATP-binding cassette, subfamily B, bacterial